MATDGSNIVVALYSETSQTMGTVAFQTNSLEVGGFTSKACVGAPYVAYGATNFLTVSGIAAQRVSPGASFKTAIFMKRAALFQDEKNDEADDQANEGAPFEQLREA